MLSVPPQRAAAWFAFGLVAFAVLKAIALAVTPLQLAGDEAHYWEWSKHLDWAYYSKGPVVALLIAAGTALFGDTAFGVRFPALVTGTAALAILFVFARRLGDATVAFVAVVLLASGLLFHTLGLGMTTDPPVLLFWVAGTFAAYEAIFRAQPKLWLAAGAFLGLATLSKYTAAIVFPSILAFLVFAPQRRHILRNPWLWGGLLVYAVTLLPILVWNAAHGWVNFAHNAGHVISGAGNGLRIKYVPELLGAQFGLVGPVLFPLLIWATYVGGRRFLREGEDVAGFLLAPIVPLALLCLGVALTKRVYANWPAPLYVNATLLLVLALHANRERAQRLAGIIGAALIANLVLLAPAYPLAFGYRMGVPPERLPSKKLIGWNELGTRVDRLRDEWASRGVPLGFVTNDRYGTLSAISFYSHSKPPVYCAKIGNRRMNQYDVWGGWERERGMNALIVNSRNDVHPDLARHFREIRSAGPPLDILYAGSLLRTFHFFVGIGFDGKPPAAPKEY